MRLRIAGLAVIICAAPSVWGQEEQQHDKRIFWIIPNYRTYPATQAYHPLTTREKFKLARQDALDPGTFALAAVFAGKDQLTNANPSFGQGTAGYAHRFATSYADWVIGDYMTEAVVPTIFHQDARYFRLGQGGGFRRLGHAVSQIFWTRSDGGGHAFNFSEILGNAAAVGISNAYYPDGRTPGDNLSRFGAQIGLDMAGNVLKEFWPDLHRKLSHDKTPEAELRP